MKTKTTNEAWLDGVLRHQVYLLRVRAGLIKKLRRMIRESDEEIGVYLRGLSERRRAPNNVPIAVENKRHALWEDIKKVLLADLLLLGLAEGPAMLEILRSVSPVLVDKRGIQRTTARSRVRKLLKTGYVEGNTLDEWIKIHRAADLRRIRTSLRAARAAREPAPEAVRRVVGTKRARGTDGATERTRHHLAALAAAAFIHVASSERQLFYKAQRSLFMGKRERHPTLRPQPVRELYVATLDSRTTPICRSLDGKVFGLEEGPVPPLHYFCRSLRVALLNPTALVDRPMRPFTEAQLLREFADKHNLAQATIRGQLPRKYRAGFDKYARGRIRELTGTVPGKTTYQEWLMDQPRWFQDDILGPTRGKLFRKGKLTLDRFVNRRGDELTLKELAAREREAFKRAGLDPAFY